MVTEGLKQSEANYIRKEEDWKRTKMADAKGAEVVFKPENYDLSPTFRLTNFTKLKG
jgi:hypothetical protein